MSQWTTVLGVVTFVGVAGVACVLFCEALLLVGQPVWDRLKAALPPNAPAITNPFQTQVVQTVEYNGTEVQYLIGSAQTSGTTLILRDFAIYSEGGVLSLGRTGIQQLGSQLLAAAKSMGFSRIEIYGDRVSGMGPGRESVWILQ
jgi:hypothetical protein